MNIYTLNLVQVHPMGERGKPGSRLGEQAIYNIWPLKFRV